MRKQYRSERGRPKARPDHAIHEWLAGLGFSTSTFAAQMTRELGVYISPSALHAWVYGNRGIPRQVVKWFAWRSGGQVPESSWYRIARSSWVKYDCIQVPREDIQT